MSFTRKWFTIGQPAEFLGLDKSTVKHLVDTGQLRATVIPGSVRQWRRIPKQDLLQLQRGMERGLEGGK